MVPRQMISGNMILPSMPGHRKPTSGEEQELMQSDFPSAAKGISVPAVLWVTISGNMTLPPMPGHRKPTSGEDIEYMQSDFPSAAKDISVPAYLALTSVKKSTSNITLPPQT